MNTAATSHYEVLGVPRDADARVIQEAYRAKMRQHHPDMPGGDAAAAARVTEAYKVLSTTGSRAAYDLDLRRGPVTTEGPTRRQTSDGGPAGVPFPQKGPISFRVFRRGDWFLVAAAVICAVSSVLIAPVVLPVLLTTIGASVVAALAIVRNQVGRYPVLGVVPAVAMVTSMNPFSRWLGVGTWPLTFFTVLVLLLVVGAALYRAYLMSRLVGVTDEKRWIFTTGQRTHNFLLASGNAAGWIGLTGDGPFDTMLMSGRSVILLATAKPTYPGETLAMNAGLLMRTRPGSTVALPDEGVDVPISLPIVPKGFTGRAAVFVPGVDAGAGPLGEVPVIGEADLLAWMAEVPEQKLDRSDVLAVVDLVRD